MTKRILLVGCSFSRGEYGSEDNTDPWVSGITGGSVLYDLLIENGLTDFEIYNASVFCSSVATQAFTIEHYLERHKPDYVIWQTTTINRLGYVDDIAKFRTAISPYGLYICKEDSNSNSTFYETYINELNSNHITFDERYSAVWLNPGLIANTANSKMNRTDNISTKLIDTYFTTMEFGIGENSQHYEKETKLAYIGRLRSILDKHNVPHIVFEWKDQCYNDLNNQLDNIDFCVEAEGLLDKHWHDEGLHLGPKGLTDLYSNYIINDVIEKLK